MAGLDDLERVEVASLEELREWLAARHEQKESVWLVTFKKAVPDRYVPYGDAVDELLCWGWIDSLVRKLDEERTMTLIAPRKKGSAWSRVNKEKIERLTAAGRIQAAGWAVIERAQADGSWSALDAVEAGEVPEDLAAELRRVSGAQGHWDAFPRSCRRAYLEWLMQAKRPETRAKRLTEIGQMVAAGKRRG